MEKTINVTTLVDSLELSSKEMLELASYLLVTVAIGNEDLEVDELSDQLHKIRDKKYAVPIITEKGIEHTSNYTLPVITENGIEYLHNN